MVMRQYILLLSGLILFCFIYKSFLGMNSFGNKDNLVETINMDKHTEDFQHDNVDDSTRPMVIHWANDTTTTNWWKDANDACANYTTRFASGLPKQYLTSFPGSGNTWTRYLLEGATGVYTGSVYGDGTLRRAGYKGESHRDDGRIIVVKTHGFPHNCTSAIHLIRNPMKAMLSTWKLFNHKGHTGEMNYTYFQTEFREYTARYTLKWLHTTQLSVKVCPKLLVVHYEQLVADPITHVRNMVTFLGYPVDKGRLKCLAKALEGPAKRKAKPINPYTPQEIENMQKTVLEMRDFLRSKGLPELPEYPELKPTSKVLQ